MIPKVRWYRVKVSDGRVFYVNTVSRAMVKIIVRMDLPSTWGKAIQIAAIRNIPEMKRVSEGVFAAV